MRLASAIVGMHIDMLTDEEARTRRSEIFKQRSQLFIKALDLDDIIGQLLALEGFVDVADIANASTEELTAIEGFDNDVADELIQRAKNYLSKNNKDTKSTEDESDSSSTEAEPEAKSTEDESNSSSTEAEPSPNK